MRGIGAPIYPAGGEKTKTGYLAGRISPEWKAKPPTFRSA